MIIPNTSCRSATSLFTNEELTVWCKNNGGHYAQENELNSVFFEQQYEQCVDVYNTLDPDFIRKYDHLNDFLDIHRTNIARYNRYITRKNNNIRFDIFDGDPFISGLDLIYNSNRFVIKDVYTKPSIISFRYVIDGRRSDKQKD